MAPGSAVGAPPRGRRPLWQGPLVAGLGFGLAYGITQRLVSVNVGDLIKFGPRFEVQAFPGTSLESLRLRFGDTEAEIRGALELQQLERQQQLLQQQEAKRRAEEAQQGRDAQSLERPLEEPGAEQAEPAPAAPAAPALPQPSRPSASSAPSAPSAPPAPVAAPPPLAAPR